MKVLVDIQPAVAQRAGVGRYTKHLVQHLAAQAQDDELVLFSFDFRRAGTPFPVPHATHRPFRWFPGACVQAAWKTVGWPPFDLLAGPADLYHFPNFVLPPLRAGRTVVTIHDLSFLRFPEFAEDRNRRFLSARIRETVARADAILTDSRTIADEIVSTLQVPPAKVTAIHPGIEADFCPPPADLAAAARSDLRLDRPYLLTVGTLEPRKNVPFAIEVFEKMTGFDGLLVVAGMPGWKYEPILDRMRHSSRGDRIRYLRYVPDAVLPALYAGASAFLFPSFYEGFGFPPLEAMACGTPVVSSDGGSLREVLGNGAVVLDRFDADLWASETRKVLEDTGRRKQLTEAGRRQAARYTWTETARLTWQVYRSLATT